MFARVVAASVGEQSHSSRRTYSHESQRAVRELKPSHRRSSPQTCVPLECYDPTGSRVERPRHRSRSVAHYARPDRRDETKVRDASQSARRRPGRLGRLSSRARTPADLPSARMSRGTNLDFEGRILVGDFRERREGCVAVDRDVWTAAGDLLNVTLDDGRPCRCRNFA
jgi:hypothetical protein